MEEKSTTRKFKKEELVESDRYANRKDLLNVLLNDAKEYTFNQVDKAISDFMKGKVK